MHVEADRGNQAELEKLLPSFSETFEKFKALLPESTVSAAQALAERYMCPMHPVVQGQRTNSCSKCGMELEQRVRLIPPYAALRKSVEQTFTMRRDLFTWSTNGLISRSAVA